MPVGVGGGFSLGSATIFLFTDATAMSRGLRNAERDIAATQKRIANTIAAGNKLTDARTSLKTTTDARDLKQSAAFVQAQRDVADAARNASNVIDAAYQARSKAVGRHMANEQRAADREKALKEQVAAADKRATDLAIKHQAVLDKARKSPQGRDALNASEKKKYDAVANAAADLAKVEGQLARAQIANAGTIAASAKRTAAIIQAENAKEQASILQLKQAIDLETNSYLNLARQAGPAYAKFATQIRANAKSIITAEQNVAQKRRNLELAHKDVIKFGNTGSPEAILAKNREEQAVRQLEAAEQRRERVYARRRTIEHNLTQAIDKEAAAKEKRVQLEAQRVAAATEAENLARKNATDQTIARAASVATIATVALAATVKSATNQWGNFEEAMIKAAAISPELDNMLGQVRTTLQSLAVELGKSPTELADALNEVAQAGFEGGQALDITVVAAQAAAAGYTDATTAARPFIGVLNAYKDSGLTAAEVSDKLFTAVTEGVFSFADLSQQIGDNISIFSSMGKSVDDILAAYVTLTKRSNSLSESTTQLNAIMNALLKPSEGLKAALRSVGIESAQSFAKTASFGEILSVVQKLLDGNTEAAGRLFPNIRSLRGIFGLTADELVDYNQQLHNLQNASTGVGATQEVLRREQQALMFQVRQTVESLRAMAIAAGADMAPAMLLLLHTIQSVSGAIVSFDRFLHGALGIMLGSATAIGVFTVGVIKLVQVYRFLKNTIIDNIDKLKQQAIQIYANIAAMSTMQLAALGVGAAIAVLAIAGLAIYQAHQKQKKAAQDLRKAYAELDAAIDALGTRTDLTAGQAEAFEELAFNVTYAQEAVERAQKAFKDTTGDTAQNIAAMHPEIFQDLGDGTFRWATAIDAAGNAVRFQQGTFDQFLKWFQNAEVGGKKFEDALLKVQKITQTTGVDVAAINAYLAPFIENLISGVPGAAEKFVEAVEYVENHLGNKFADAATRGANAIVTLGDNLTNTDEFFGNAADRADDLRESLKTLTDQTLVAAGALPNMDDPLSFIQGVVGGLGDTFAETLVRAQALNQVKFSEAASEALTYAAAVDQTQAAIDDMNAQFKASDDVINEWENRLKRVDDIVGTAADGYANLNDMLRRGRIDQEQYNDILASAQYLHKQAAISIDNERVAQAKALPALAAFVKQHEDAVNAYADLSPEAQGFAEAMKDTTNQAIILTVVMLKLAAALNPDAFDTAFLDEFIRQIATANPEAAALLDTLGLIPENVKTQIQLDIDTGTALRQAEGLDEIDQKIRDVQNDLTAMFANAGGTIDFDAVDRLQKRLDLLQQKKYIIETKPDTADTRLELAELDKQLEELGLGAEQFTEAWQDAFNSLTLSASKASDTAAQTVKDTFAALGAIPDIGDPLAFLNQALGTSGKTLDQIISKIDVINGPMKLTIDQQEAIRVNATLRKTEERIAKLDDAISQNADDMAMWQDRIALVDDILGDDTDTLSQWEAKLAAGTVTQEEFNNAVASGEAHAANAKLLQLRQMGLLTEKEYNDALKAGIFIRERATGGIFDERAEQAKMLPQLAALIQLHDRQDASYDKLTGSQKRFLAGLSSENVQMALSTALMLAQLEAMGAVAEGTTQKFVDSISASNAEVGAFFDEIDFKAANLKPNITVQVVLDPEQNVDDVVNDTKDKVEGAKPKIEVTPVIGFGRPLTDDDGAVKDQTFAVHANTKPADDALKAYKGTAATHGTETGQIYDQNLAQGVYDSAPLITRAVISGLSPAIQNSYPTIQRLGNIGGQWFSYGVAQGVLDRSTAVGNAVRFLAKLMYLQLRLGLAIRSPSRKGYDAGSNFVQGTINAVLDRTRDAVKATRDMATQMNDALTSGLTTPNLAALGAGAGFGSMKGGLGVPVAGGAFVGPSRTSTDNSVAVGAVSIEVSGASGDKEEIADAVWQKFHGSIRRLNKMGIPG